MTKISRLRYIAVLDYEHLDNALFLTLFAQALAQQKGFEAIVVHGESEYTERLIQSGIMRDEAVTRCIKDLNHRLIALFADQEVSAIGLNGYQRECITLEDKKLEIDIDYLEKLHKSPVLLLSNLVLDRKTRKPVPIDLPMYVEFLADQLNADRIFLFSKYDHASPAKYPNKEAGATVPEDLKNLPLNVASAQVTTISEFDELTKSIK